MALALLCLAAPALTQTTGNIEGLVADPSGAALPGAAVEATSANLQGTRTAVTETDGRFRMPAVPPGTYKVKASLAGFTTVEKTAYVTLDSTATVSVTLQISAEEKVLVTGETPLIDLTSTTTGTNFSAKVLERMSIGRNYADIVLSQPGVNIDTSQNLAGVGDRVVNIAMYGSTSLENLYMIDGINTTNVIRGFQGKAINPESMQEVEIKTGGYQAEYGRALGGVINVITKSGGNEFHGDAFGNFNSRSMRAEAEVNDEDIIAAEQTEVERWDAGADLGGYILKDRLWFFGSYDRIESQTTRIPQAGPVAEQAFLLDRTSDTYSGKLTWNIGRGSNLVVSTLADPEKQSGAINLPASTSPLTYSGNRYLGARDYAARLNQLFGSFGILTLQYSRHADRHETKIPSEAEVPRVADRTVPGINVSSGGFGNINRIVNHQSTRDGYSANFTAYVAEHEIKLGGDYEYNETAAIERRTAAQTLTIIPCRANPQNPAAVDRCARVGGAGVPYVNWRGENVNGGVFYSHSYLSNLDGTPVTRIEIETPSLAYSAFVQDTWRVSRRLTVNAGLRWDREEIQDFERKTVIDLDDMWSPRAGVVWDFAGDGTSKVYGSYGRFYYQFPTDLNVRAYGNNEFLFVTAFNYDPESLVDRSGTAFGFQGSTSTPLGPEPTDRNLKGMYQDEYTIGVEKALTPTFVVGLKGNYQRLGQVLEDRCDLDYEHPDNHGQPCAIINPGSSERYARGEFPCSNAHNGRPDASELDALCNENGGPPIGRASRIYRGIELTARQSFQERLWVQASYIFSSLRGNYDGAARLASGQADPGINADFDYFAFDQHNSHGKLYLDRPHSFQLGATYRTPFGLTAGLSTYVRSGPPRSKAEYFGAGYIQEIFGVRRGTAGRAETQYEANVSLAYEFKAGPLTIAPRVSVFNLLNRQGETRVQDAFNPDGAFDASGNAVQH
ncbi:MAG: carboxypeptidase regulatory-like domain-containing protein, partial [Acidobacteriota bacterium]|nr:carboxypeptidase regulatory-like domain-containing protein [Acidobacteriota bacterium]